MTTTREHAIHALRILALSVGLGLLLFLILYLFVSYGAAHLSAEATTLVLLVVLVAFVVFIVVITRRRHALWTPAADVVEEVGWVDDRGEAMVTVVELAKIEASTRYGPRVIRSRVLRISVYRRSDRRRKKRIAVGDAATYLGHHGERFWFLIGDRYHAGRIGLVGYERATLEVTFHLPGSFELADEKKSASRAPIVRLKGPEGLRQIDLREPNC